jgi:NAD(P)-dependent dehydrogenase (short-subunit alcohol dehydrogenase family)
MDKVLITGASKGIGRALATKFAAEGYSPVIHGRSKIDCIRSLQDVWSVSKTNATFYLADLLVPQEVLRLIEQIRSEEITGIVLNAGSYFPHFSETLGLENTLLVNYLSRYILLKALLPELAGRKNAFVIDVSGKYHRKAQVERLFSPSENYDWQAQVALSKWANVCLIHHYRELGKYEGIKMMSWHPGAVKNEAILQDTRLKRKDKLLYKAVSGFFISPEKAAANLWPLFKEEKWSTYAEEDRFVDPEPSTHDRELQSQLLQWSAEKKDQFFR